MFIVLAVESGEPVTQETFASAAEANAFRATMPTIRTRIAPAPVDDSIWRQRESDRLESGEYVALPQWWQESAWWRDSIPARDHFAHRAKDGTRIAYTESSAKGAADRQTVTPASTYLARFFGDKLKPHEIAALAAKFETEESAYTLKIDSDVESFRAAYAGIDFAAEGNSYPSCMRYHFENLPAHPATVYAAGDLAIARLYRGADYVARAIVWPAESSYVRIYGAEEKHKIRLVDELESRGYGRTGAFDGARLSKIEICDSIILMPYIDGDIQHAEDYGDYLRIESGGSLDASVTSGKTRIAARFTCDDCGDVMSEDNAHHVGRCVVCESCLSDNYTHCEWHGEYFSNDDSFSCVNVRYCSQLWHESAVQSHAFYCESTEEYYSGVHWTAIEVNTETGPQTWCEEKTTDSQFYCEKTEQYFACDDFTQIEVVTPDGFQTWCEEETRDSVIICMVTGKTFSIEAAALENVTPAPDFGIIQDARQIAFAFA